MSGLLAASRALPRWQWGAPLPTQPDSAHPVCMTPLGWDVSFPPLPQMPCFFSSASHRITRCIAGSRSPFPPSTTGTVQGEPGSSPGLVGIGKGNGIPLSFPLPRRHHPSAQRLLLFFSFFCTGSLDQALLESFSESQGWGGTTDFGLSTCNPRENEPPGRWTDRPGYG